MYTPATGQSFLSTRRGRLTLALVCLAGFLDFIDTTIVNVALPSIREQLGVPVGSLQWIISGYLLTYGGFLLFGGRAADLFGRRRMLIAGTALFGLSSLAGGLAASAAMLIGARLAQGLGAAMMTPAALSILTTSFAEGSDRVKAIGAWSGTIPLASAIGVLAGGLLSQGPGWRWVFFVNLPVCAVVLAGALRLLPGQRHRAPRKDFDLAGAILPTAGALVLVYALVKAPDIGWGNPRTISGRVPVRGRSLVETPEPIPTPMVTGMYAAPAWIGERPSTSCRYSVTKKNIDKNPAWAITWVASAAPRPGILKIDSGNRGFARRRSHAATRTAAAASPAMVRGLPQPMSGALTSA